MVMMVISLQIGKSYRKDVLNNI